MRKRVYVCPIHEDVILFKNDGVDLLIRIKSTPEFCSKCSKHYFKYQCKETNIETEANNE